MSRGARAGVAAAIAWVPLLLLSMLTDGSAGSDVRVPFLGDLGAHVRLLVGLPMYLLVPRYIDPALRGAVAEFLRRRLVLDEAAYRSLTRHVYRHLASHRVTIFIVAFAFVRSFIAVEIENAGSWLRTGHDFHLSAAGWWYAIVSLPLLFTVSGWWLWKVLVWTYFLAKVARLPLRLVATHPDGAGGIGFIGQAHYRLALLASIANISYSAKIAVAVLFLGRSVTDFQLTVAALIAIEILVLLAPLIPFIPMLMRLRRQGSLAYGRLSMTYVRMFEERWARPKPTATPSLLGSADIQSLADMGNSFAVVEQSRSLLVTRGDLFKMIAIAIAPFLPLLLTVMSFQQLLEVGKSILV